MPFGIGRKPIRQQHSIGPIKFNTSDTRWTSTSFRWGRLSGNSKSKKVKLKGPLGWFVEWKKGKK
jgi:hypothetical protein